MNIKTALIFLISFPSLLSHGYGWGLSNLSSIVSSAEDKVGSTWNSQAGQNWRNVGKAMASADPRAQAALNRAEGTYRQGENLRNQGRELEKMAGVVWKGQAVTPQGIAMVALVQVAAVPLKLDNQSKTLAMEAAAQNNPAMLRDPAEDQIMEIVAERAGTDPRANLLMHTYKQYKNGNLSQEDFLSAAEMYARSDPRLQPAIGLYVIYLLAAGKTNEVKDITTKIIEKTMLSRIQDSVMDRPNAVPTFLITEQYHANTISLQDAADNIAEASQGDEKLKGAAMAVLSFYAYEKGAIKKDTVLEQFEAQAGQDPNVRPAIEIFKLHAQYKEGTLTQVDFLQQSMQVLPENPTLQRAAVMFQLVQSAEVALKTGGQPQPIVVQNQRQTVQPVLQDNPFAPSSTTPMNQASAFESRQEPATFKSGMMSQTAQVPLSQPAAATPQISAADLRAFREWQQMQTQQTQVPQRQVQGAQTSQQYSSLVPQHLKQSQVEEQTSQQYSSLVPQHLKQPQVQAQLPQQYSQGPLPPQYLKEPQVQAQMPQQYSQAQQYLRQPQMQVPQQYYSAALPQQGFMPEQQPYSGAQMQEQYAGTPQAWQAPQQNYNPQAMQMQQMQPLRW